MEPLKFISFLISKISEEELLGAFRIQGKIANITMGRVGVCLHIII